jgi:anaerobic selenocysteine-containing dehydrogenase
VTFSEDPWDAVWTRVRTSDGAIHVDIAEMVDELRTLADPAEITSDEYPLVLSAGERRSFTANTIIRDASWRKRDSAGALRVSPADADRWGLADGDRARITTPRGTATVTVEVSDTMQAGHVSLPNGMGLDEGEGRVGTAPNELTSGFLCDPIAGTPWHKSVPARLEPVS